MSKKEQNAAPSRGRIILYSIAALFCLFGLADATYLAILALTGETAACSGQAGCQEVLGSVYAKVAGIPVAAFGVAGYFTAFSCAIFAGFDYALARFSRPRCGCFMSRHSYSTRSVVTACFPRRFASC
jgi:uncharacterized membrane protein